MHLAGPPPSLPPATRVAVPALAVLLTAPRVEHPGEDDDYTNANEEGDPRDGFCEDAESSHPSQPVSSQGRPAPTPCTALLMAVVVVSHQMPWDG